MARVVGRSCVVGRCICVGTCLPGVKGILSISTVGVLFTLVVLIFGSLWPAIVLHALIDIGSGLVAWLALRQVQGEGVTTPA